VDHVILNRAEHALTVSAVAVTKYVGINAIDGGAANMGDGITALDTCHEHCINNARSRAVAGAGANIRQAGRKTVRGTLRRVLHVCRVQRADRANRGNLVRRNARLEQVGSRLGMAMAAMIRMIATTITNSIREKPLASSPWRLPRESSWRLQAAGFREFRIFNCTSPAI
jgi:hypothetical protein